MTRDVETISKTLSNSSKNIILPTSKISVQIPLVDFDFSNGGTRIIPKTHKEKLNTKSCLIRDVRALHGAGINKSKERRAMLVIVYSKEWLSPLKTVSKDLYFNIDKNKRHVVKI
jgi:hypothetical protein